MSKTAEELQAELTKSADTVKTLTGKISTLELLAKMSDTEKSYTADMDDAEKAKFMAKPDEERKSEIDAKAEAKKAKDPVIYKSADGTEFRKSDDPRVVKMAKERDEDRAEMKKMRDDAANAAFEKRATVDFAKFKGELPIKTALVKAVAGIKDDDTRKGVEDMLSTVHKQLGVMFKEVGTSGGEEDGLEIDADIRKAAETDLDKLAKKYATEHKVSFEKAYDAVLSTDEGQRLYAKTA